MKGEETRKKYSNILVVYVRTTFKIRQNSYFLKRKPDIDSDNSAGMI